MLNLITYRRAHIMKQVKKTQYPSNFLFFDTETRAKKWEKKNEAELHYLWFGWIHAFRIEAGNISREVKARFETVDKFWELLEKRLDKKRPLYVFAHNICFDLTIVDFWRESGKRKIEIDFMVIDDPPTMIGCKINECQVYFVDTLNYWRTSLAKLGESLGLDKLTMPKETAGREEWDRYCFRDVEVLSHSVLNLLKFIDHNDLGKFAMTAPSLAMSAYKHRFMSHKIWIHDRIPICNLERGAYYGGLVECFHVNKIQRKIYYLDVNSLYPYVMQGLFPTKLVGVSKNNQPSVLALMMNHYALCAHVNINSHENTYPLRVNKKLCMVRGRFSTFLCGPELIRAYKAKDIHSINLLAWYEQAPIFKDYVKFFWEKRLHYKYTEKNSVYEQFCKLLMNSLYGKFGQRGYQWVDWTESTLKSLYKLHQVELPRDYAKTFIQPSISWGNKQMYLKGFEYPVSFRKFGNKIQVRIPLLEHHESFPLIAAYVTSYGREHLRKLIDIAGKRSVFYCDTDSLFVDKLGHERLVRAKMIDGQKLGMLKLEDVATQAQFHAPKDYFFGDTKKSKGIRKNAEEIEEGVYKQLQFEGVKSILNREPEPFIKISKVIKRSARHYDKGNVMADGWVEPFEMEKGQPIVLF